MGHYVGEYIYLYLYMYVLRMFVLIFFIEQLLKDINLVFIKSLSLIVTNYFETFQSLMFFCLLMFYCY